MCKLTLEYIYIHASAGRDKTMAMMHSVDCGKSQRIGYRLCLTCTAELQACSQLWVCKLQPNNIYILMKEEKEMCQVMPKKATDS